MLKIEPDENSTLILGRGINSVTLEEKATPINVDGNIQRTDVNSVIYELKKVENLTSLREMLNVSASASFSYGSGSASAKASYFNSVAMSTYSLFLCIHVKVSTRKEILNNYVLKDSAGKFFNDVGKDEFFSVYGDEFIGSVLYGGEFLCILQIKTETNEEKSKISSSLEGSYGFSSGRVDFEKLERVRGVSTTQLYLHRRGGSGALPSMAELYDAALDFPEKVTGNDTIIQVMSLPFGIIENFPKKEKPISLDIQRDSLERMAKIRDSAVYYCNDYRFSLDNPFLFKNQDLGQIQKAYAACSSIINSIDVASKKCLRSDGLVCEEIDAIPPYVAVAWEIPLEPSLSVMVHVEGISDMYGSAGEFVGTRGRSLKAQGIAISINPPVPGLYIEYRVHMEGIGDSSWFRDGAYAGTRGQHRRIEGFWVGLLGPLAKFYDVTYTGEIEGIGEMSGSNGQFVGTTGQNKRCEGLRVKVSRKS